MKFLVSSLTVKGRRENSRKLKTHFPFTRSKGEAVLFSLGLQRRQSCSRAQRLPSRPQEGLPYRTRQRGRGRSSREALRDLYTWPRCRHPALSVRSCGVRAAISHPGLCSEGPWARPLPSASCQQLQVDSAPRRRKIRLYCITRVSLNCEWALPLKKNSCVFHPTPHS